MTNKTKQNNRAPQFKNDQTVITISRRVFCALQHFLDSAFHILHILIELCLQILLHISDGLDGEVVELRNIIASHAEVPPRGIRIVGLQGAHNKITTIISQHKTTQHNMRQHSSIQFNSIRFNSTVFIVTSRGIAERGVLTHQCRASDPGLRQSLGLHIHGHIGRQVGRVLAHPQHGQDVGGVSPRLGHEGVNSATYMIHTTQIHRHVTRCCFH